jgi:DNA helicase HerA-like ATPase
MHEPIKGQIISGTFSNVTIREKPQEQIEVGELLVAEEEDKSTLLLVYDLEYASQISSQNIEYISGLLMQDGSSYNFKDEHQRSYVLAQAKSLITVYPDNAITRPKGLPRRFNMVRTITENDCSFLTTYDTPLFVGHLRSGSKVMQNIPLSLDGKKALSHHVLLSATTGKGKSNLCSVVLWNLLDQTYVGALILDPHDEYFGRTAFGLSAKQSDRLTYYTPESPPPGEKTLKIHIPHIKPSHLQGILSFTDPQYQAMQSYYKRFGPEWIEQVFLETKIDNSYQELTVSVLRRKLMNLLGISFVNDRFVENSIFSFKAGHTTIKDVCSDIEAGKKVIIDTSHFSGSVELLIGSLITTEIFSLYKHYKNAGTLAEKPVISIVLEEAPRVLGKDVLEKGSNVFEQIAREGRKFKIGLFAITQLPSLIPKPILANMNTKIILGTEMANERQSLIESSFQDLSDYSRAIASLDTGEALISSSFVSFPYPVKIPYFNDYQKELTPKQKTQHDFSDFS